jgi:hypothetical protein
MPWTDAIGRPVRRGATYHRIDILKRGFDDVQKVIFASRATVEESPDSRTGWRSGQSSANPSLRPKIPDLRENTGKSRVYGLRRPDHLA